MRVCGVCVRACVRAYVLVEVCFDCVLQIKECSIVTVVAEGCVGVDSCMAADVA